jgi:integrase/recombinase XerD
MKTSSSPEGRFAKLIEEFFLERLIRQRNSSPQTVAAYRDCFRLLFEFARDKRKKPAESLKLADLDAPLILAFLDHLEKDRNNSIRSRNARLAAIRSFLRFAAWNDPEALAMVQRALAIPMKRCTRPLVGFLSREEVQAIINAPDPATWTGQRDQVLLSTLYNTGARVSEARGMTVADVTLAGGPNVRLHGKGRKDRTVPIWPATASQIRRWLVRIDPAPGRPLFPAVGGGPLTRSAITDRLKRATKTATTKCASLSGRRVSPHTLRHTTAMHLLQSGVDITLIALWLGHESPSTTHIYIEADLKMKEDALKLTRYCSDGDLSIDNNATERSLRGFAVGRNYVRATIMCSPPLPAAA